MPTLKTQHDNDSLRATRTLREGVFSAFRDKVEQRRLQGFNNINAQQRSKFGQFATPSNIASQMAAMFRASGESLRLLDAGAGVGSLSAAVVAELCSRSVKPRRLEVTCVEINPDFAPQLGSVLGMCGQLCTEHGISFETAIQMEDFIAAGVSMLTSQLFAPPEAGFDCAVLNPPYRKIGAGSVHRQLLADAGIQAGNLYAAFMMLAVLNLKPLGELVAITPRSFCNGPYFKPFRQFFLREMTIQRTHVFESRNTAFGDEDVLQENIIVHAVRTRKQTEKVIISTSHGPDDSPALREIDPEDLVRPDDAQQFIHVVAGDAGSLASQAVTDLPCSLSDLGLSVSTGRLVEFRSREWLVSEPHDGAVPLIYPAHFANGWISWPKLSSKKPKACLSNDMSRPSLIPAAVHVLTKRFSAKEEKRRIVAAIFDPARVQCEYVAFENHVNYFHQNGNGLEIDLAKGLTLFLNSTVVDTFFRQFSGHTQVNASDLRNLKYPTRDDLSVLGRQINGTFPSQQEFDQLLDTEFARWQKTR